MKQSKRIIFLGALVLLASLASFLYLGTQLGTSGDLPELSAQLISQSQQMADHADGFARVLHFLQRIIAQ